MNSYTKLLSIISLCILSVIACNSTLKEKSEPSSDGDDFVHAYHPEKEFNDYWYQGKAELSHYKLKQARYGELRDGDAVLIFVTEDESPETHVKAGDQSDKNIPILKNNFQRSFVTGIYPYSLLTTTSTPVNVEQNPHSMRVSFSGQEWCGMVFNMLDYKNGNWNYSQHSYFPNEGDMTSSLDGVFSEDEIWNLIRIDYKSLPQGEIEILPSLMHLRLHHEEMKVYHAIASLIADEAGVLNYELNYSDLDRKLIISFEENFPLRILSWTETYKDGFGNNAQELTTEAKLDTTIMLDYWSRNSNADSVWRKVLMGEKD